jgi:hypothetical protein
MAGTGRLTKMGFFLLSYLVLFLPFFISVRHMHSTGLELVFREDRKGRWVVVHEDSRKGNFCEFCNRKE